MRVRAWAVAAMALASLAGSNALVIHPGGKQGGTRWHGHGHGRASGNCQKPQPPRVSARLHAAHSVAGGPSKQWPRASRVTVTAAVAATSASGADGTDGTGADDADDSANWRVEAAPRKRVITKFVVPVSALYIVNFLVPKPVPPPLSPP